MAVNSSAVNSSAQGLTTTPARRSHSAAGSRSSAVRGFGSPAAGSAAWATRSSAVSASTVPAAAGSVASVATCTGATRLAGMFAGLGFTVAIASAVRTAVESSLSWISLSPVSVPPFELFRAHPGRHSCHRIRTVPDRTQREQRVRKERTQPTLTVGEPQQHPAPQEA